MKKIRIMAFISALFVFMFSYLIIQSSSKKDNDTMSVNSKASGKYQTVIVAKTDILPNTLISDEMIEEKEVLIYSDMQENNDYFLKKEDIVGRIATSDIFLGEIINNKRSVNEDGAYGLAAKLEDGMRAITIDVDLKAGIGGNLKIGDYVDLIIGADLREAEEQKISAGVFLEGISPSGPANTTVMHDNIDTHYSFTAIQNLKVLALDNKTTYTNTVSNSSSNGGNTTGIYSTVTLQATPKEVEKIAYAQTDPEIHFLLSLRKIGEHDIKDTSRESIIKNTGEVKTEESGQVLNQEAKEKASTVVTEDAGINLSNEKNDEDTVKTEDTNLGQNSASESLPAIR